MPLLPWIIFTVVIFKCCYVKPDATSYIRLPFLGRYISIQHVRINAYFMFRVTCCWNWKEIAILLTTFIWFFNLVKSLKIILHQTMKISNLAWQVSYSNVKYPRYKPTWPRRVQEVKAPKFLDTRHMKVVWSSLVLIFRGVDLSDASEKIPSDMTGDLSRDLPTSSAAP